MGLKLNIIIGAVAITLCGAMWFYIQFQAKEITQLKANAVVLEGEIQKQNESIKNYLENQKQRETQIADLQRQNQESQREVSKLKNTFARHNMDNLALNKPGLIENIINKGTKKVKEDLIALTEPSQYD
tara:strand:+ start:187 stop:573 length:387 start_codon:yes stop_codon:yes gene_type:complete